MTVPEFIDSLNNDTPPKGLSGLLDALWWDGKGDWDRAHRIAQEIYSNDGSWVHAYLHRKEGDQWNAQYWYNRAGKPKSNLSLENEWRQLLDAFISG